MDEDQPAMIRAKETVESLEAYSAPLEGRRGMLRLDFNENTLGPSPKVIEAIRSMPVEEYAIYPEYNELQRVAAKFFDVKREEIGLFNGADAAIRAVFDAFGEPGTVFLTTAPTFGYYQPCAAQQGMVVRGIPYPETLEFPLDAFREALADKPRIAFICNPNNPTGTMLDRETILELAAGCSSTLFVIDELYATFTGVTVLPESLALPNLLVLRSLSKSSGLAALRLGFAIGAPSLVDRVSRVTGPYDINSLAVRAGIAAMSGEDEHTARYIDEVARAKAFTLEELEKRGVRYFSDGGNYLLVFIGEELSHVVDGLRGEGILVRSMAGKPVIDGSFRLTIGTREQMERFFGAFDRIR